MARNLIDSIEVKNYFLSTLLPKADEAGKADIYLSQLSSLHERDGSGCVCVNILEVGEAKTSRKGWRFRKLLIEDDSLEAELLIDEDKFVYWSLRRGDCLGCEVKSWGIGSKGMLTFVFKDVLTPFNSWKIIFDISHEMISRGRRSALKVKNGRTVYQISDRGAADFVRLMELYLKEGKPQYYNNWCDIHQISATDLFYMGLVDRAGHMKGLYYPTKEGKEFFRGKAIPKKKVFIRDENGIRTEIPEGTPYMTISELLQDHANRESVLREYTEALAALDRQQEIE